jgi:A/G-specific adenine glycosylase
MELGAVVCTPSSPRCEACPVATDCFARTHALVAELPVRTPGRTPVEVAARAVLVAGRGGVLGHRIAAGEPNAGQVELPGPGVLASCDAGDLQAALRARFGARLEPGHVVATVRHAITHHRIVLRVHAAAGRSFGSLRWFALGDDVPWTTPARKVFRQALGGAGALRA